VCCTGATIKKQSPTAQCWPLACSVDPLHVQALCLGVEYCCTTAIVQRLKFACEKPRSKNGCMPAAMACGSSQTSAHHFHCASLHPGRHPSTKSGCGHTRTRWSDLRLWQVGASTLAAATVNCTSALRLLLGHTRHLTPAIPIHHSPNLARSLTRPTPFNAPTAFAFYCMGTPLSGAQNGPTACDVPQSNHYVDTTHPPTHPLDWHTMPASASTRRPAP
jgi:hypothetical protein